MQVLHQQQFPSVIIEFFAVPGSSVTDDNDMKNRPVDECGAYSFKQLHIFIFDILLIAYIQQRFAVLSVEVRSFVL